MTKRSAIALLLALAALALAGCGGDDGDDAGEAEEPAATETAAAETDAGEEAAGGDPEAGMQVFASAGCGGCHTLEEAGSTGQTAPVLDGANLSPEAAEQQIRQGGGGMPSFEDQLSDEEIANVTAFVVEASQD